MAEIPKPAALAARGGVWFRSGTAELHLGVEADFRPARKAHPGLLVDDLDAVVTRLAGGRAPCPTGRPAARLPPLLRRRPVRQPAGAADPGQLTGNSSSSCWTGVAGAFFAGAFLAAAFFAGVFFAGGLLRGGLLGRGLLRRLLGGLLQRRALPPVGEQLGGPLDGDRLDVVALAQAGVGLAVGDVGTEPALADDDRPPVTGSSPSSFSGAAAAARRPRCLGWAKIASASSSVTVNSLSSLSSERESVPFLM